MNPLTRALKLAEDPQPRPASRAADRSSDPAVAERRQIGPIRATRDDPVPEVPSPAAIAVDDASGPEAPGRARLAPMRATRVGSDPEIRPSAALAAGDAVDPETPSGARLAAIRATRVGVNADADVPGDDFVAAEPPAPARTAPASTVAGALCDTTGTGPADAGAMPAATRGDYDFRSLRRGRSIGRLVGVALSLLAVAGAAVVGGTFLWRAELARPALVPHLPALPVAVMDLTPVHAANAAVGGNPEPAADAVPRTEDPSAGLPTAPRNRGHPVGSAMAASAGLQTPSPGAPRSEGPPNRSTVAPGSMGHSIVSTAPPRNEALPTAAARSTRHSAGWAAAAKYAEHPTGSPAVSATPAPESSSTGLPAPAAPAEPGGIAAAGRAAPAPEQNDAELPPGSRARIEIRKRMRADHVSASLERAWEAYLAGDGETAGQAYRTVLGHEPRNRDARLGLAAVAVRAGRWDEAAGHYATLLASHPADTAARAALIAIGEKDPARAESRLKALLRDEPEAAHLHFSLGNLYASQSRWPEAQQSWIGAYRLDRGNADHAYNLAVSLDHLSQSRSALDLYREALVLARSRPAGFDAETVLKRIRALEPRPDAERVRDGTNPGEAASAAAAPVR